MAGAAVASAGWASLIASEFQKIAVFIVLSPVVGLLLQVHPHGGDLLDVPSIPPTRASQPRVPGGSTVLGSLVQLGPRCERRPEDDGHHPGVADRQRSPAGDADVPLWVVLSAHTAIGLGTLFGGWRIVHTMGSKITKLQPAQGMAAETAAAATIMANTVAGIPVSTTANDHGRDRGGRVDSVCRRYVGVSPDRSFGRGSHDPRGIRDQLRGVSPVQGIRMTLGRRSLFFALAGVSLLLWEPTGGVPMGEPIRGGARPALGDRGRPRGSVTWALAARERSGGDRGRGEGPVYVFENDGLDHIRHVLEPVERFSSVSFTAFQRSTSMARWSPENRSATARR